MHGAVFGDMYFWMFGVQRVLGMQQRMQRELLYRLCGWLCERVYEIVFGVQRVVLLWMFWELWE